MSKKRVNSMVKISEENTIVQKELETTSLDNSGSYGNLFDIVAHRDMNITSLAVHADQGGFVEVWTRDGAFAKHYTSSDGWRMVANATIEGKVMDNTPIPASEFEPVFIKSNDTRAFFVRMLEPNLRYTIVSFENGYPYVNSNDLDVLVGSGFYNYSWGEWELQSRMWNGVVYYSVEQEYEQHVNFNSVVSSSFEGLEDDDVTLYESNGNIFEVHAFKDMWITSVDIHMGYTEEPELIRVFSKEGSFLTDSDWVNICQTNIKGRGPSRITNLPVDCFDPIILKAGSTITLMVNTNKANIISSAAQPSIDYIAQMTDDLLVKTGFTIGDDFKPVQNSTVWNGIVRYSYTEDIGDTQQGNTLSIGEDSKTPFASFGMIFDIHSLVNVTIEGIQVMTTDSFNNHAINYTLWTKHGSYLDNITKYENMPYFDKEDGWVMLSNGQLMKAFMKTQTDDNPHTILFDSIYLQSDEYQSFYIGLNYASLFLSSDEVGDDLEDDSLKVSNSFEVNENGKITTSKPLALHKGSIYYSSTYTPPSQAPSLAPTPEPTNATIPYDVDYTFSVMYESSRQSEVLKAIDSFIFTKLETVLKDSNLEYYPQLNQGQVQLVNVSSSFSNDDIKYEECIPEKDEICSFVQSTITTSYNGYIPTSMLRFIILTLAPEANSALPFKHHEYIGIVPLFTEPVVSLGGVDDQLDSNATSFYEGTVKDFLNEMFQQSNNTVKVTDVSTTLDDFAVASRRFLQRDKTNGVDIATGVFGEYQPPPQVVFDKLVKESVETNAEVLVEKLKKSPKFQKVKDVEMTFVKKEPVPVTTNTMDTVPTEESSSSMNLPVIIGASVGSLVFLVCCLLLSIRSVKSKQSGRHESSSDDIYYHNDSNNHVAQSYYYQQHQGGFNSQYDLNPQFDVISKRSHNMMYNH